MLDESRKCPHGHVLGKSRMPRGIIAAPLARCDCCLTTYWYIDAGTWSSKGSKQTINPKDRCRGCGGEPREIRTGVFAEEALDAP